MGMLGYQPNTHVTSRLFRVVTWRDEPSGIWAIESNKFECVFYLFLFFFKIYGFTVVLLSNKRIMDNTDDMDNNDDVQMITELKAERWKPLWCFVGRWVGTDVVRCHVFLSAIRKSSSSVLCTTSTHASIQHTCDYKKLGLLQFLKNWQNPFAFIRSICVYCMPTHYEE